MADKKNATVALSDPSKRAEIEARRGIKRDAEGRIIRSKPWLKERIAFLEAKVADFAVRTKNAKAEIAARKAELNA